MAALQFIQAFRSDGNNLLLLKLNIRMAKKGDLSYLNAFGDR